MKPQEVNSLVQTPRSDNRASGNRLRCVNQTRKSLDNTTRCASPVFLMEQPKNYQDGKNVARNLQRGHMTWKDMFENAWNDIANWQRRKTEQPYKLSSLCLDDHQIKKEELENKGELAEVCSHIVLKMLVRDTNWST